MRDILRPAMMLVAPVPEGDNPAGIDNGVHRVNPFLLEAFLSCKVRSPQKRISGWSSGFRGFCSLALRSKSFTISPWDREVFSCCSASHLSSSADFLMVSVLLMRRNVTHCFALRQEKPHSVERYVAARPAASVADPGSAAVSAATSPSVPPGVFRSAKPARWAPPSNFVEFRMNNLFYFLNLLILQILTHERHAVTFHRFGPYLRLGTLERSRLG
jgi:hypothetical protein